MQLEPPNRESYRFTGKEWDEETKLYYMSARYQNPMTSRWMSADPAASQLINPMDGDGNLRSGFNIVESTNPYSYVGNNPIRYNDPSGMNGEDPLSGETPTNNSPPLDFSAEKQVYEDAVKDSSNFTRPDGSHCDEYATEVITNADRKSDSWPNPLSHTVTPKKDSNAPSYQEKLGDQLQDSPSPGINVMIMSGGDDYPDSPHMAVVFVNENGSVDLTHYTGNKIRSSENWADMKSIEGAFKYDKFQYLPRSQ